MIKKLVVYIVGFFIFSPLLKSENIDSLYSKGNYNAVIEYYASHFDIKMKERDYFILAKSYYHVGDIGLSILNYERALRLDPNNKLIIHNLDVARLASVDKQNLEPSPIYKLLNNIIYFFSPKVLIILAILSFIVSIFMFVYFRVSLTYRKRKLSFVFSLVFFALCILFNAMLFHISYYFNDTNNYAIVTDQKVDVNTNKEKLKELHSGYKLKVLKYSDNISMIELQDGTKGEIPTSSITPIATN